MRTFIKEIQQGHNTGGNIYNDVITLVNGYVIRISEDGIGIYTSSQSDIDGDVFAGADFTKESQLPFMTDSELDDVYELNVGYRAIKDGATRAVVIDILTNWKRDSNLELKF